MQAMSDAFLRSWPTAPWLAVSLVASAAIYAIGWRTLRRRDPTRWSCGRLAAFVAGLVALYLALASPIETFATLLLSAHMVQHLLLMMIAPPLLWLGWPLFPLLCGLPVAIRSYWVAPLLRARMLRSFFGSLTHPLVAWPLYVAMTWLWHTPPGYQLGLSDDRWHIVQHSCFFGAAMLFWFPVVRPYPSRPRWPQWWLLPYLLLADVQNTLLAAWLTFTPGVLYDHYRSLPPINGISALDDQRTAGVLMWVPGSILFLVPMFWIAVSYLRGSNRAFSERQRMHPPRVRQQPPAFDLLDLPGFGAALRWRPTRRWLQILCLAGAVAIAADGFLGPQVAPLNLAGVVPWIHWRGALVLILLVAGNFFCLACPFTLPRALAARWLPAGRPWPNGLRSKWLATGLVCLFLWSYEAFALWDSPWITAWIIVGYFVAAFIVDALFSGATFCKYVCPIGQFNFVQSLVSPLEVTVRDSARCESCTTHECIRGSTAVSGCQLALFQPRKVGNFDCTFCLDCVHACPHDNVGILAGIPSRTLWIDPSRSGIGRFSQRHDLAALTVLLVFGAFVNAAGMVAPIVEVQDQLSRALGDPPRWLLVTGGYLVALVALPTAAIALATGGSRWLAGFTPSVPSRYLATCFAYALVPLGFGMWVAHYSFHFLTSWATVIPALERVTADMNGLPVGNAAWACACCENVATWIPHAELLFLDFGLLASLYAAFRVAERHTSNLRQTLAAIVPWAVLIVLLFAGGVWIVFQPMEMRGTLPLAG